MADNIAQWFVSPTGSECPLLATIGPERSRKQRPLLLQKQTFSVLTSTVTPITDIVGGRQNVSD